MTAISRRTFTMTALALCSAIALLPNRAAAKEKAPAVGDEAADFQLKTADGEEVALTKLLKQGPVVLIVLRGYPGYQCPACNTQTGQFLGAAKKFAAAKANIVLVYPGPADGLKQHAEDFTRGKTFPDNCYLALDPDFAFTNAYRLRWDAKNETAYPSTFIIDEKQKIVFAKISMTHGGRTSVDEVLKAVPTK
ncbi:redoxin domain-containing protein [Anatilimnocola sp. NA78]|uniref:redoxin domain-containing protein n=1 Tax=Anatilimnocola sp. NA78 TaxID=3415683 RepID=UPI003CE5B06E